MFLNDNNYRTISGRRNTSNGYYLCFRRNCLL